MKHRGAIAVILATLVGLAMLAVPTVAGATTNPAADSGQAVYVAAGAAIQAGTPLTSAQINCLIAANNASVAKAPTGQSDNYYLLIFALADETFDQPGHTCATSFVPGMTPSSETPSQTAQQAAMTTGLAGSTAHAASASGVQYAPVCAGGINYIPAYGTGGPYCDWTNIDDQYGTDSVWIISKWVGWAAYAGEVTNPDCFPGSSVITFSDIDVQCPTVLNDSPFYATNRLTWITQETAFGWVINSKSYWYYENEFINGAIQIGCHQC